MDNKEFIIRIYELKKNLLDRFKSEENNKFLQILHISTVITCGLLALGNLKTISKFYLVCSVTLIFLAYFISYLEELSFMKENTDDLTVEVHCLHKMLSKENKDISYNEHKDDNQLRWTSFMLIKAVCVGAVHVMIVISLIYNLDIHELISTGLMQWMPGIICIAYVIYLCIRTAKNNNT